MSEAVAFWQGDFGNRYTERNAITAERLERQTMLWSHILGPMLPELPRSVMEVGANVGANLLALRRHLSRARLSAVEPNDLVRHQLVASGVVDGADAYHSLADAPGPFDLTFTCGVLIHVPPDDLLGLCQQMHARTSRWIAAVEYFAADPEEKTYRGHAGKLWKRDFGSFYLDNFPDLRPVANGFAWKRTTGLDDLTWWLFEKR